MNIANVSFTQRALDRWTDECERIVRILIRQGVALEDMPEEQGRENSDGSYTIYVTAPNGVEHGLVIPAEDWTKQLGCIN